MIARSVPKLCPRFFVTRRNIRRHRLRATNRSPHKRPAVFLRFEMKKPEIHLEIEPLEEGGFVATSPDVPGLVAEARSVEEVTEVAGDVARAIVESCREHGDPLPPGLADL